MNQPTNGTVIRSGRGIAAGFVAAALLTGCVSSYPVTDFGSGSFLQARIYQPSSGTLQFAVSQPAYAALFAIVPGRGATLLYPTTQGEAQRRLAPGAHSYLGSSLSLSRLANSGGRRSLYGSSVAGPTTLILIASAAPLNANRLMRQPAFMGDLRLTSFYSHASDESVARLADLIIPDPVNTDWTYDTYTLWPDEQRRQVAAYRVACPDGRTVVVVRGVHASGCRVQSGEAGPPPAADTAGAPPADTAQVAARKRPRQPSDRVTRTPGPAATPQASVTREAEAGPRPRSGLARESRPKSSPPARARTVPTRERQQVAPARQKPAEKSERPDRPRRTSPAS